MVQKPFSICLLAVAASLLSLAVSLSSQAAVRLQSFEDRDAEDRKVAPAVFACSAADLAIEVVEGATGDASLTVSNTGGSTLRWRLVGPRWIAATPSSGQLGHQQKAEIVLRVDASALEPGTHNETLTFAAPGASNEPPEVAVVVTVVAKPEEQPKDEPTGIQADQPTDEAPTETSIIDEPPDDEPIDEPPPKPITIGAGAPSRGRLGCHAGLIMPGSGKLGTFGMGYALDVFWRSSDPRSRLGYELALGVSGCESDSGFESTTMATGSASALVHLKRGERSSIYALAGMSLAAEESVDSEAGTTSATGSLVDLGIGGTFGDRFDARVRYSAVLGSRNVGGIIGLMAGLAF